MFRFVTDYLRDKYPDFFSGRPLIGIGKLLLDAAVSNGLSIIIATIGIGAIVTAVARSLIAYAATSTTISLYIFGGTSFVVLLILLFVYYRIPRFEIPDADYSIISKHIIMEYVTRERISYIRKYRIRVKSRRLDRFHDTYAWSGDQSKLRLRSQNEFHSISISDKSDLYTHFDLLFNKEYKKGDVVDFTLVWDLEDPGRAARPFASHHNTRPMRELLIEVILHPNTHSNEAIGEITVNQSERTGAEQVRLKFDGDGRVLWKVKSPKLFKYYTLRWAWNEEGI